MYSVWQDSSEDSSRKKRPTAPRAPRRRTVRARQKSSSPEEEKKSAPRETRPISRSRSRSRSRSPLLFTPSPAARRGGRFRVEDCAIPQVWCGEGALPADSRKKRYAGTGTAYQCFKKGFGAGMYSEKRKNLPRGALQSIPYVGAVFAANFGTRGITTTDALLRHIERTGRDSADSLLRAVFTRANGSVDVRALNSTLIFAHEHGIQNLPACERL